jgi:4-hydroxymandelate oxidase
MIAPTASQVLLHPDGEMAMHQGATAASNTPMLISFNSSFPADKIAAASTGPLWYQLYLRQTPEKNREIGERIQDAGCKAIVITVDAPVGELRERALHLRHLASPRAPTTRGRRPSPDPNQKYGALTGKGHGSIGGFLIRSAVR